MSDAGAAARVRATIRERLGGTEYQALFAAVRRRLEHAGVDTARSVTLRDLRDEERVALADLLGARILPGARARVSIARLDQALRRSNLGAGVIEVVEALSGPLVDRRAERDAARAAEDALWASAARHPVIQGRPALERWLDEVRARGLLGPAARRAGMDEAALLELALQVIARLPAGGVILAVLASEVTGDAHALDPGRPLANLVLRAAACVMDWPELPASASSRRRLWAEVGVLCDPLSADVLVLGVRPAGAHRLDRHLNEWADAGEPRRITLRELTGVSVRLASATDVFVCENPGVVAAAADRLGARCAPLVCTEGVPSTAALELLRLLGGHGARLRFHTDFDWSGVRIGNFLAGQLDAVPWRLGAHDYGAALVQIAEAIPLRGAPAVAAWDPELHEAMACHGLAIYEEQVLDVLLGDLERAPDFT